MTRDTARALEAELNELSQEMDDLLTYGPKHDLKRSRAFAAEMLAEHENFVFQEIAAQRAMEAWR